MFKVKQGHIFTVASGLIAASAMVLSPQQAARAAEAADSSVLQLEEIIVTARKREEKLIDVPISIQVFGAEEIKQSGISDIRSLQERAAFQLTPQVSTGPGGRMTGTVIFRGLQANSFGANRDNSGSLFVDGVYISGGQQSINTVEVSRIEVLKGPQNAYFGRSTFGGAINFITRNPSDKFSGVIDTKMTARGSIDSDISIEGPLAPGLLTGRLTAVSHNKADQYTAGDGGGMGGEKSQSLAGTLYFTPAENLWFRLRGSLQRDNDDANDIALIDANTFASGACTGKVFPGFNQRTGVHGITLARNYFCNGIPTLAQVGTNTITASTAIPIGFRDAIRANSPNVPFFSNVPNTDHSGLVRNSMAFALQSGYTFDSGASFAFNAGYNQQKSMAIWDIDRTDANGFLSALAFVSNDLTLDARFLTNQSSRIRGLVGVSYYRSTYQNSQMDWNYGPQTATRSSNFLNERVQLPAAYASVDFDILKNLTLTAEGRYQKDKPTSINPADVHFQRTFSDFLPRVSIKYSPIENMNVYATYAKGVQPAGFNGTYVNLNPAQQAYVNSIVAGVSEFSKVPEVNDYEVGIKQSLLNGSFEYNLAIYQMDWKNAVTTSSIFNPDSCFNPIVQNTPACPLTQGGTTVQVPNDARVRGIELAITERVTEAWSVDFTADYKDAKWVKYANSSFNTFAGLSSAAGDVYRADGNHMGRVPALQGTLSSTYRGKIDADTSWYVRGDLAYTGSAWDSDLNIVKTDAYTRANARLGLEKDNMTLELFSTNLFNDKTWDYAAITVALSGNFTQRAVLVQPAQKREFGLRASYKF
jgi:iron complex outermembrane receptor protein